MKSLEVLDLREVGSALNSFRSASAAVVGREDLVRVGVDDLVGALPEARSSATFCTSAVSSSCEILMSIPVSSLNGARLAAIADVGAVFSEMKFSCRAGERFHSPAAGLTLTVPPEPPQPASQPGTASAAAPMPAR